MSDESTGRVTNAALDTKLDGISNTVVETKILVERALSDITDHETRIRVLEQTQPDHASDRLVALEQKMPDDAKGRLTALERFNWKVAGGYAAIMAAIGIASGILSTLVAK